MRAFPQDATLDLEDAITAEQIDAIAERVAAFHHGIESAGADSHHGTPEQVQTPIRENFRQLRELGPPGDLLELVAKVEDWVAPCTALCRAQGTRLHT